MNKKRIEKYLPYAVKALRDAKIANIKGEIPKAFRGQISSFGAAIAMGSFKAAVAFFSEDSTNADSKAARKKLIEAIWLVLEQAEITKDYPLAETNGNDKISKISSTILRLDEAKAKALAEEFIDASIALKLAMNAYCLTEVNTNEKSEPSV